MKKYLNKNLIILILLITIGVLFDVRTRDKAKIREQTNLVTSLNNNLKTWKDKNNQYHAKISVIETQNAKDFLTIHSNDSTIKDLQNTVKKYRRYLKKHGSATVIHTSTGVSTTVVTKVVYKDTTNCTDMKFKSKFNLNGWVVGNTIASKDSTSINFKIKNVYSIVIGQESQGLFKRRKPFAEVINKNPYSETKSLKTYEVSMPKIKRFGVGPMIGVGLGANGHIQWIIGIGVQYNLIRF